jgi:membrane associated rhomboid family serine protease
MAWQDRAYNKDGSGGEVPPVVFSLPKLTVLTWAIMAACAAVFVLQRVFPPVTEWGVLTFADHLAFRQPWRWITYQYLHANVLHIGMNMLGVFFFVPPLERIWGWRKTLAFYTVGGVVAGVTYGLMCAAIGHGMAAGFLLGASGSIFAALGAVALLMPETQLILLIFPVPIRAAAALFGIFFFLTAVVEGNLSDAAHLGGLAFGFCAPWLGGPLWRRQMRAVERRAALRTSRHLDLEQRRIDQILAKVSASGMHSLNWTEKRALRKATERQRQARY